MLEKTKGRRRRGQQSTRWLDAKIDSLDKRWSTFWLVVEDRETWLVAVHGVAKCGP